MASDSEHEAHRPLKRPRRSPSPTSHFRTHTTNGNGHPPEHMPSSSSSSSEPPLRPLSLSILGVEPLDEFIREIADFVHHMIYTRPDVRGTVEVEAKLGVLRDRHTGERVQYPVLVETILAPHSGDTRFESNMSLSQHKHFNNMLNNLKTSSSQPGHPATPLDYTHLHLIDTFYQSDTKEKIRVTRDEKSGTVLACMQKVRLGNLDIYSPKRAADWRVTVNLEIPVPPPLGSPTLARKKDRMSYSHEEFTIDLTQVTSTTSPNSKPEIIHELELELSRPDYLLSTAQNRGDPNASEVERNAFDELIRAFVNNARILVRNAGDGWQ
ncbi:mRNA capping enzyme [Cristinia sonorae]|uniref:mRNA-capping enzyme subunit beta n=1 Tax=Cristinia sonorae TaxID=1940300 RepID=A0A8K0UHR6_9AGAR|nr:mRNA capping enzyme [Cristinia sonorae]